MSQSITNMNQVWLSNTTSYNAISMSVSTLGYGANANSSLLKMNVDGNTKFTVDTGGSIRMADYAAIGPTSNNTGIVIHGGNNHMTHDSTFYNHLVRV